MRVRPLDGWRVVPNLGSFVPILGSRMRMKVDIYDALFKGAFIVQCKGFDALVDELKTAGFDTTAITAPRLAKTLYCEHADGRHVCVLWFSKTALASKELAAIIAHEVHHAAWFTLEARGVSSEEFVGETGAYYTEWLMAEVIKCLRTASKSRKKR